MEIGQKGLVAAVGSQVADKRTPGDGELDLARNQPHQVVAIGRQGGSVVHLAVYLRLAVTAEERNRYLAFFRKAVQRRLGYLDILDGTDE